MVGGFWIIQVKSREEALEWASRIPGKDNEMVEVRRLFDLSDFDPEVQQEIPKRCGGDEVRGRASSKNSSRFIDFDASYAVYVPATGPIAEQQNDELRLSESQETRRN